MTGRVKLTEAQIDRLRYKYAHIGCPAAKYEDNCAHPDECAENGRCKDLAEPRSAPFAAITKGG